VPRFNGVMVIGILIGAALLQVLQNLVNLPGFDSSLTFAVVGEVVPVGVLWRFNFYGSRDFYVASGAI